MAESIEVQTSVNDTDFNGEGTPLDPIIKKNVISSNRVEWVNTKLFNERSNE